MADAVCAFSDSTSIASTSASSLDAIRECFEKEEGYVFLQKMEKNQPVLRSPSLIIHMPPRV